MIGGLGTLPVYLSFTSYGRDPRKLVPKWNLSPCFLKGSSLLWPNYGSLCFLDNLSKIIMFSLLVSFWSDLLWLMFYMASKSLGHGCYMHMCMIHQITLWKPWQFLMLGIAYNCGSFGLCLSIYGQELAMSWSAELSRSPWWLGILNIFLKNLFLTCFDRSRNNF